MDINIIDNKTGLVCRECGDVAYISTGLLGKDLYCLNCAYELKLIIFAVNVKESIDPVRHVKDYLDYLDETSVFPDRPHHNPCPPGRMCYCAPFEKDV